MTRYAAIVLAAGQGSRFRKAGGVAATKLVALLSGQPLVRRVVETALASMAEPTIVVTGHERNAVMTALAGLAARTVHNPLFASGLASTLRAGVAALPNEVAGAVILLGDMPGVCAETINLLIAHAATAPEADAIAPTHGDRRGNPILLSRSLFARVADLSGDAGARHILQDETVRVVDLPIGDQDVFTDIDVPADIMRLQDATAS